MQGFNLMLLVCDKLFGFKTADLVACVGILKVRERFGIEFHIPLAVPASIFASRCQSIASNLRKRSVLCLSLILSYTSNLESWLAKSDRSAVSFDRPRWSQSSFSNPMALRCWIKIKNGRVLCLIDSNFESSLSSKFGFLMGRNWQKVQLIFTFCQFSSSCL